MKSTAPSTSLKLGIALFAGLAWFVGYGFKRPWKVKVADPRTGDLARVIREEGRTRYRTVHRVTMPLSGRLLRHPHEEGDVVTAGQALAQVIPELPAAAVRVVESEIESLKAELTMAEELRDEQARLQLARARVDSARSVLRAREDEARMYRSSEELARTEKQRLTRLRQEGAVTQSEIERAQAEEQRTHSQAQAGASQEEAARSQVQVATSELEEAQVSLERQEVLARQLRARIEAARARLVPLADEVARTTVASPIAGQILEVHQQAEGVVPAGSLLFEIGDPGSLEVEVEVLSEDALAISRHPFQAVYGPGLETGETPVTVRGISPRGFTKRSSLGVEEQRVKVWFTWPVRPEGWGHGYRVILKAAVDVARGACLLPRRSILSFPDSSAVYVVEDGRARRRNVTTRLGDESWIALTGTLDPVLPVILDPPEALQDGDSVEPTPAADLPPPAPIPGTKRE